MGDAQAVAAAFIEAFNAHDEARIRELYAEDAVFEGPGDVRLEGREAVTGYAMSWLNAFGDARLDVRNELVAGDSVVQEFVFEGTHTGTLQTPAGEVVPATNRQLRGRGLQVMRIEDGALADTRLYFDQVDVLTQLGLMPRPRRDRLIAAAGRVATAPPLPAAARYLAHDRDRRRTRRDAHPALDRRAPGRRRLRAQRPGLQPRDAAARPAPSTSRRVEEVDAAVQAARDAFPAGARRRSRSGPSSSSASASCCTRGARRSPRSSSASTARSSPTRSAR